MGSGHETERGSRLRLLAFAEPPAQRTLDPTQLHVYIVNESPAVLDILNDLDSINIAPDLQDGKESICDADLMHIDFGVSESATFLRVHQGHCAKVTLLLTDQQLSALARAGRMTTTVKFRDAGDTTGQATTVHLPAIVYTVTQP